MNSNLSDGLLHDASRLDELRRLAASLEPSVVHDSTVGNQPAARGLLARVRDVWNKAIERSARPQVERQSAFNRALVDWLEQPPGQANLGARLLEQDGEAVGLVHAIALAEARVAVLDGDRIAGRALFDSPPRRLRIAYFSPMPPDRSGIADYSAGLLPHLAKLAEVTLFTDAPPTVESFGLPVRPLGDYPRLRGGFDLPLYQMGNSAFHEAIYDLLLRYPGVVVLHDYFLHHFIRHHTLGRGDWAGYGREMAYSLGAGGRELAHAIHAGRAETPLFEEPLNKRLIDVSLGLIVHSRFVAERALQQRPNIPLAIIPHLAQPDARPDGDLRARLGLPAGTALFGSFGQITPGKRIDLALQAFQRMHRSNPATHYLLVGEVQSDVDLPALIAACGLENAVHSVGFIANPEEFVSWIHAVDVVVNLRQPTVGETSGVAIRALAAALPLIVFDHGWYSELPDGAAAKVPPDDVDGLQAAMERLAGSAEIRQAMGLAGLEYVRRNCSPPHVAHAYVDFLRNTVELVAYG